MLLFVWGSPMFSEVLWFLYGSKGSLWFSDAQYCSEEFAEIRRDSICSARFAEVR